MPICQICRSSHCGRVEFRPTSKFGLRIWPSALRDVASDTVKWSASCIYFHPNASPALASNVTFSVLFSDILGRVYFLPEQLHKEVTS